MKFIRAIIIMGLVSLSYVVSADEQGDREREIIRENTSSETYNDDQSALEERERKREEKKNEKPKKN